MGNASSSNTSGFIESTSGDSGLTKLESTKTNVAIEGELVGLLKLINDHKSNISTNECIKRLYRIIELLPRHIEFMISHSGDIIDMSEFGIMCRNIYGRYKLVYPDSFDFDSLPSNKSILEYEIKLLHHLKIIADILRGSKNRDLPAGAEDIDDFLTITDRKMSYVTLSPHKDEFRKSYHEIAMYLQIRDGHYHEWGTIMRCIRWYIETLTKIINMIQTNTLDPTHAANLDEYILVPGCRLFGISTDPDPMTTLLQLVTNAEELLQFKMSLIEIDWIARRQSLIPATRHASIPNLANAAKANAVKALLTSDPFITRFITPFITKEERAEMIAAGGISKILLEKLLQQQPWPHPQTNLKGMISRVKDAGSRRRKTKPKSRKNKHSTKLNSIFS